MVVATGTGNTVVSDDLPAELDFGHQLAGTPWTREVVVRNEGSKEASLVWNCISRSDRDTLNSARNKAALASGGGC